MSVDCAGQKPPIPIPVIALATNPCHASSTAARGEAECEDRERHSEHPSAAEAVDERAEHGAGDETDDSGGSDDRRTTERSRARCAGR